MKAKYELAKEVGIKIRFFRKELLLSQAQLAGRCGKDPQAIELVENGKTNPTLYTLYLIASALEQPVRSLFDPI